MNKNIFRLLSLSLVFFSSAVFAETQWDFGISGGSDGIREFHLAVGNYYRVPEKEVIIIRERGIPDEELPVVFFLCRHARVSPKVVIFHRLRGMSWHDITIRLGLSPEIYYVPVIVRREGPPYGHAYGHYRKHPKERWSKIELMDRDIVNQVNLEFITKTYGYDPGGVMRMRENGASFLDIERKVHKEKGRKESDRIVEARPAKDSNDDRNGKKGKDSDTRSGQKKKKKGQESSGARESKRGSDFKN